MPGPSAARALGDEGLEAGLERGVEGRRDLGRARARGDEAVGEVGRERRERAADGRHRLGAGGGGLLGVEDAGGGGAGEDAVAGGAGGLGRAVGAAGLGRLRQRDEERGLGGGEAAGLLAEPGEARGADALEVAAVGGEGEVEAEDRVLVEAALEGEGDAHLAELAGGACRSGLPRAGARPAW